MVCRTLGVTGWHLHCTDTAWLPSCRCSKENLTVSRMDNCRERLLFFQLKGYQEDAKIPDYTGI